jgi:hypothetical protein
VGHARSSACEREACEAANAEDGDIVFRRRMGGSRISDSWDDGKGKGGGQIILRRHELGPYEHLESGHDPQYREIDIQYQWKGGDNVLKICIFASAQSTRDYVKCVNRTNRKGKVDLYIILLRTVVL